LSPPRPSLAWDQRLLPVRGARFLDEQRISGPGFNAFRDGGYVEMARPGVPAFIDSRVQAYPDQAWSDLQEAEKSAESFQAWLRRIGCEWAIATRVRERIGGWRLLYDSPDWALVYWDDASEVFVRRDVARFSAVRDALEYRYFHPWGHLVEGLSRAELPLLLQEAQRFERTTPGDALARIVRCAALRRLGSSDADSACDLRVGGDMAALLHRARSFGPAP